MNEHEAERIAAAVNVLRPDWPTKSLLTLMRKPELASRPRRDVLVALAWVASETNSATPARVLEAGPWWRAVAVDEPHRRAPRPPHRNEACLTCGYHLDRCICGERRARPEVAGDAIRGAAAARAALRDVVHDATESEDA